MGRHSTGVWTTSECLRIELSYLLSAGYLVRGALTSGTLSWVCNDRPSGNITIISHWPKDSGKRPSVKLVYTITDDETGKKEDRNDTVYLESVPSNLGRGEVLYFVCPSSGRRCRILYKAYGSYIWKSRESYQNRIYYTSQQSSKREYANNRYWDLEKQIKTLRKKRIVNHYRGKITRRANRLHHLETQQDSWDCERFLPGAYPVQLRKMLFKF